MGFYIVKQCLTGQGQKSSLEAARRSYAKHLILDNYCLEAQIQPKTKNVFYCNVPLETATSTPPTVEKPVLLATESRC